MGPTDAQPERDHDAWPAERLPFIDNFVNLLVALEYQPWKHVGFGLGVNWKQVFIEVDGETDVPGVDFIGDVEFSYLGALLYLKFFY